MTDRKKQEKISDSVEDVEAFAFQHGISAEEAQDLIDRIGHDRKALEDAVLVLQAEKDD